MTINDIYEYKRSAYDKTDYFLSWQVNNLCNYHCWFCAQIRKNNYRYTEDDVIKCDEIAKKVAKELNEEFKSMEDKKIKISMIGGEPTLSDLPTLLDILEPRSNKIILTITTNFSCTDEYLDRLFNAAKKKNITLNLSVSIHQTEVNLDNAINKIIRYQDIINSVNMVIYDEKTYEDYIYMVDMLKECDLNISPQVCLDNGIKKENKDKIILTQDILNKLEAFTRSDGNPDKILNGKPYFRHDIYKELGEVPVWTGFKCWAWTKVNYRGERKHCAHSSFNTEGKLLRNDYEICTSLKPCKFCYQTKLERVASDES